MFWKLDFGFSAHRRFRHLLEPENPNLGNGGLGDAAVGERRETATAELDADVLLKPGCVLL